MPRNTVALVWIGGLAIAAAAYAIDPGHALDAVLDLVAAGIAAFFQALHALSAFGGDMVRALALGLFAVFVGLAVLAIRQGRKGRMALITVSTVFLLLVHDGQAATDGRWATAFVLAAIAALVMTGRLRRQPG